MNNLKFLGQKIRHFYLSPWCIGLVLLIGIFFRVEHYVENNGLWEDEAVLAVNITGRSVSQIFLYQELLGSFAKPPMPFQILVKSCSLLFGNHEYALRLIPFLAGIFSLFLYYKVLQCYIKEKWMHPIALFLFSIFNWYIYYSATLKQYNLDVLMTLIVLWGFYHVIQKSLGKRSTLGVALGGAAIIWISNSSLFLLCSVGLILGVEALCLRNWKQIGLLTIVALVWIGSFFLLNKMALSSMVSSTSLLKTWGGALPEAPLFSKSFFLWTSKIWHEFSNYLNAEHKFLFFSVVCLGIVYVFRYNKKISCMFVLPIMITFVAAVFQKYPFRGRLLLFLTPMIFLLQAYGIVYVYKLLPRFQKIAVAVLIVFLFSAPIKMSVQYIVQDRTRQATREVMETLAEQYRDGDNIFISNSFQYMFWYYAAETRLGKVFSHRYLGPYNGEHHYGVEVYKFFAELVKTRKPHHFVYRKEIVTFREDGIFKNLYPKANIDGYGFYDRPPTSLPKGRTWLLLTEITKWDKEYSEFILSSFSAKKPPIKTRNFLGVSLYLYDF